MTKLSTTIFATITLTIIAAMTATPAQAMKIFASEDARVAISGGTDQGNLVGDTNSVLSVFGATDPTLDGSRNYYKFSLPNTGAASVVSAIIEIPLRLDTAPPPGRLARFAESANETWSDATINWTNQPGNGATIAFEVDVSAAGQFKTYEFDVLSLLSDDLAGNGGDGVVSFMLADLRPDLGNSNYVLIGRFNDHPYDSANQARLILNIIPEPAALSLLGMGGLGLLRRRR